MPDIRVLDEQGTTHVFPDGSTPEMIAKVMGVKPPAPKSAIETQKEPDFWDTVYRYSGIEGLAKAREATLKAVGPYTPEHWVKKGLESVSDWAKSKAAELESAQLKGDGSGKSAESAFYLNAASDAAKLGAGALDPKNLAIAAGAALAPEIAGPALVAHGGYGVAKNIGKAGTPEGLQNTLLSASEMAGGAASTAAGARTIRSQATGRELYQSALKPSTTLTETQRNRVLDTGLREGIPVSKGGQEKLGNLMDEVNQAISDKIKAGNAAGATVNKFSVASRLADTYADVSRQVNPVKGQIAVGKTGNEFLASQPNEISLERAQAVKQGTYQQIKKSYGQLSTAAVESQKALARGLKEEIAAQFPEIADLNVRDSNLIGLDKQLERAVNRISNHQMMGIGTPLAAAGVKAATGSTGAAAVVGILKAVIDDPLIKSRLAISLSKGAGIPLNRAQVRIARYAAALASSSSTAGPVRPENEQPNE